MAEEKTDETQAAQQAAAGASKARSPWLAVAAVIILVPGISFALTQYLLIPHIKAAVSESQPKASSADAASSGSGKPSNGKGVYSFDFPAVVVNLAGTMGTRYLKVTFTVFSSSPDLQRILTEDKPHLLDTTLSVLSSRSLADLETPGAMELVSKDLVAHFNKALDSDIVSQIYFSEFVVQ
jgi:flagellar protein FliL